MPRPFEIEFPDFPVGDMPAMPEGFEDSSWHNDACPCLTSDAAGFTIWVDYADPSLREISGSARFLVGPQKDGVEVSGPTCATEDWNEVLAFLAQHAPART